MHAAAFPPLICPACCAGSGTLAQRQQSGSKQRIAQTSAPSDGRIRSAVTMHMPMCAFAWSDIEITYVEGSTGRSATHDLPLSYEQLYNKAAELFDITVEDFELWTSANGRKLHDNRSLDSWWTSTKPRTVHVKSKSIALHDYTEDEGLEYLTGSSASRMEKGRNDRFSPADIVNDETWPDVDVTCPTPLPYTNNNAVLYLLYRDTAARLHGPAKRHDTMRDHMGQMCAALKIAREEYCRRAVGKRKRADNSDPPLVKVPHVGILTTGSTWIFVRSTAETGEFVKSAEYLLPLTTTCCTRHFKDALLAIVARIVQLLRDQKKAFDDMEAQRAAKGLRQTLAQHHRGHRSTGVQGQADDHVLSITEGTKPRSRYRRRRGRQYMLKDGCSQACTLTHHLRHHMRLVQGTYSTYK
ncbi:hypothetical protein JKP88DRAFT_334521 [Tribonema minus]|uniref:Uncharacterized protein n=1 Tax=Tribonema minus TaxID=303371 RepID=A0A835YN10_9STRA|nr:hypothetical protein JKP88DRAFT_334521 [Tribonema minus]